jgi:hypothetical protein
MQLVFEHFDRTAKNQKKVFGQLLIHKKLGQGYLWTGVEIKEQNEQ